MSSLLTKKTSVLYALGSRRKEAGWERPSPASRFFATSDGGTRGLPDRQVLELAAASGRILVSHDRNTMVGEFYRFIADGHSSPGLIIVEQELDEGDAIEDLLLICGALAAEELRNQIWWVPM